MMISQRRVLLILSISFAALGFSQTANAQKWVNITNPTGYPELQWTGATAIKSGTPMSVSASVNKPDAVSIYAMRVRIIANNQVGTQFYLPFRTSQFEYLRISGPWSAQAL